MKKTAVGLSAAHGDPRLRRTMAKTAGHLIQLNGRLGNAARRLIKAPGGNIIAYATSTVTSV
jgi:hypothetical protein